MQDRVLDAPDVLVDRHPPADVLGPEGPVGVPGRAVAEEVPRRVDEGVHRVGVPPGRAAAARAVGVDPVGGRGQRRGPLGRQRGARQMRQLDRQLILGHRHLPTRRAVDDRDRGAPVPLAAQQPVPQPVGHRTGPAAVGLQLGDDRGDPTRLVRQPVQRTGVDVGSVARGGDAGLPRVRPAGGHHLADLQPERPGEVQVALIVGRHRHDRSGAVLGQHVVGGVDRDPLAVDRVDRVHPQEDAGLGPIGGLALDLGGLLGLIQVRLEGGALVIGHDLGRQ